MSNPPRVAVLGSKQSCLRLIEGLQSDRRLDIAGIVTVDDREDARSQLDEISAFASLTGIPIVVAESARVAYQALAEMKPELVAVVGWYRIIPPAVLTSAKRGFFGIHYSLLPRYRGSAPVVWAMLNGDDKVGYSIFQMSESMDEGPLAAQGSVALSPEMYIEDVLENLDRVSVSEFSGLIVELAEGTRELKEQDLSRGSYSGARTPSDGRIDWSLSALELERFVRAQSHPYPGAFSVLNGQTLRIWRARTEPASDYYGVHGHVVRVIDGNPVVACGKGTGLLLENWSIDESPDLTVAFSLLTSRFA